MHRRPRAARRGGFLTSATMDRVEQAFARFGNHQPSEVMWSALEDLVVTLESMALRKADPKFYLSSLDPGVGKTTALCCFVDALLSYDDYEDVGVLIALSRLDQIAPLTKCMGVPKDWLCVLTTDKECNALGGAVSNEARVLFTTHAMVQSRTKERPFSEVQEFQFQNCPRSVRVYDEGILPGEALTVSRDDFSVLLRPIRPVMPTLAARLEEIFLSLKDATDGKRLELPDYAAEAGVDLNELLALLEGRTDDLKAAASWLWFLSGKVVTIRNDGAYGETLLDYRDTLQDDLAPMVIMDASGRVRRTYRNWETRRGGLVRLEEAPKHYAGLTVHTWERGGGKGAWGSRSGADLAAGVAAAINAKSTEEWLVVCHKARGRFNPKGDIEKLLTVPPENVHWLTWGSHDATNAFSHVKNVILAGTLFYRPSYYEALGRASAGLPSSAGPFPREESEEIAAGEFRHLILQAACRGAVRLARPDGGCAPCDLYVIASVRSGIPNAMSDIFPGCSTVPWRPVARELRGNVLSAVRFLERWRADQEHGAFIPFKDVQDAIGVSNAGNFKNQVRDHPDFQETLAELGLIEWGKGKRMTGFLLPDQSAAFSAAA